MCELIGGQYRDQTAQFAHPLFNPPRGIQKSGLLNIFWLEMKSLVSW